MHFVPGSTRCYNPSVSNQHPNPDIDRLSTLAALVLLSYGMVRVIDLPTISFELSALGVVIPVMLNTRSAMLALAAALAVVGADWLAASHPHVSSGRPDVARWVLPGLAALGIGSLLTRLPEGGPLWIGLGLAAALLMTVFVAEFTTIDPDDPRRNVAAMGLEALSYLLLLEFAFSVRLLNWRAVFAVPALIVASGALAWRLLRLRLPEARSWLFALMVGWGIGQLAWALHYLPIPPLRGALLILLAFYLVMAFVVAVLQEQGLARRLLEYGLISALGLIAILTLA
jgi:hypothetical protein